LIESAVSSNRIEGVTVEPRRVRELILGQPLLRDRDEDELRGYRVKTAYREFAERVGEVKAPRGAKTDLIAAAISGYGSEFTLSQLELACPGVSRDMVRRVLRDQQAAGLVARQGRGPAARWQRKG
jgi:hypothetical protein